MKTEANAHTPSRLILVGLALLLFGATFATLNWRQAAHAAQGQLGTAQITLNPGGGVQTNGSDGLRFTINATTTAGWPGANFVGTAGQDAVSYRNTVQYCCSAGAPMLNVGGTLYGQAGPASSSASWTSIDIISTSGVTSTGPRTSATGNSSATVKYTAVKGGLTYTVTRSVSYIYPNDYVTDSYTFLIPSGNSDAVKFYLGGDTAPGSSDSGYGIMLTQPVRSVISLNTFSRIMFGFREVDGSKPFDGATTQSFSTPYGTVQSGGNIGFVATNSNHDAGLMMQWNLGNTPGTQTATMQQFATQQGTNLNAALSSNTTDIDTPVSFSASIVNTELTQITGLGYTLALPNGLVIGSGSQTNTCGGTATANAGSSSIVLSGAAVNAGANCIVTVPVLSSTAGTYTILSSSFSSLQGTLTNNVGALSLTVADPVLGTDLNGDGTDDAGQANVYGYTNPLTDKAVVLEVSDSCSINEATSVRDTEQEVTDGIYQYVNGLMDFSLACGTPGATSTIKQYYYGTETSDLLVRKYNPNTQTYSTIEDATIEEQTINGNRVVVVSYEVVDGGELDTDELEDGNIRDPAGLASIFTASQQNSSPSGNSGSLAKTGSSSQQITMLAISLLIAGSAIVTRTIRATD